MAKPRSPKRAEAKQLWLANNGTITTKELAARIGVSEPQVRKWKSFDRWGDELNAKKRGGQKGNRNAAGHGAPKGNANALVHGVYARVRLENLTPQEREYIEQLTLDVRENILRELKLLSAKERDLSRKINFYENSNPNDLFIDRVVEMLVPKDKKEKENTTASIEELKTAMRTVIKSSPFDRIMKLEAEHNKTHGRILKLIDTMRAHEIDKLSFDLNERKHTLTKQRLAGEYTIDPDTGEIDDRGGVEDVEGLGVDT